MKESLIVSCNEHLDREPIHKCEKLDIQPYVGCKL